MEAYLYLIAADQRDAEGNEQGEDMMLLVCAFDHLSALSEAIPNLRMADMRYPDRLPWCIRELGSFLGKVDDFFDLPRIVLGPSCGLAINFGRCKEWRIWPDEENSSGFTIELSD